jgi:hypothetical protein
LLIVCGICFEIDHFVNHALSFPLFLTVWGGCVFWLWQFLLCIFNFFVCGSSITGFSSRSCHPPYDCKSDGISIFHCHTINIPVIQISLFLLLVYCVIFYTSAIDLINDFNPIKRKTTLAEWELPDYRSSQGHIKQEAISLCTTGLILPINYLINDMFDCLRNPNVKCISFSKRLGWCSLDFWKINCRWRRWSWRENV